MAKNSFEAKVTFTNIIPHVHLNIFLMLQPNPFFKIVHCENVKVTIFTVFNHAQTQNLLDSNTFLKKKIH